MPARGVHWAIPVALAALLTVVTAFAGWTINNKISGDSRITRLETQQESTTEYLKSIDSRLQHIDDKMDKLMEGRTNGSRY